MSNLNQKKVKKKGFSMTLFGILIIMGVSFFGGLSYGYSNGYSKQINTKPEILANTNSEISQKVDFTPFWKAWNILDQKFVPSSASSTEATTDQERVWGSIEGLASSLNDPYTIFTTKRDRNI